MRLPLARNSESSRDLRPRPPAANKSAGRLQTQNFHVGKSQDGRERSGAPRGKPARNAWRPALEWQAGELAAGAEGATREGTPASVGRSATTRPQSQAPLGAPHFASLLCTPARGTQPTAPPALALGGRSGGDGGGRFVGGGGEDTFQTCCTGATAVQMRYVGGGGCPCGGEGGWSILQGQGVQGGGCEEGAVCKRKVVCRGVPPESFCLMGQGESQRVGGWSGGEKTA